MEKIAGALIRRYFFTSIFSLFLTKGHLIVLPYNDSL